MANTIDAYCDICKQSTNFSFVGEDWECQKCGSLNTDADSSNPKTPYNSSSDD